MPPIFKELDVLQGILLRSDLQQTNQPLYQVILQLIKYLRRIGDVAASGSGGGGGGGGGGSSITNIFGNVAGPFVIDGIDGEDGIDGIQGINGSPGPQGVPGVTTTIIVGIPGIDGLDGEQGEQGIPGATGATGSSGGGGGSATTVVVTAAFPAKLDQKINVIDATVATTSKILVWLSGIADGQPNSADLVELLTMYAVANTGSFDLNMHFLTPWAGSLSVNYMVMA